MSATGYGGWDDLNATLHTLQYYYAGVGTRQRRRYAYWGGLQDNGTRRCCPARAKNISRPAATVAT